MIYLDNSATTYPKPRSVWNSASDAMKIYGANAGRGAYNMAVKTTEQIYECRKSVSNFFGAPQSENAIFTYNCTTALNMAIKGLASRGAHFVISDLEHNAVLRPLEALKRNGICTYSIASVDKDDFLTLKNFKNAIKSNTVAIVCTGASNVFGIVEPIKKIGELAHRSGIKFIVDAAQIAGVIPINMSKDNIDIICCAGHKGLYGLSGTGLLILGDGIKLNTVIEGGTGSNSAASVQPNFLPDRFESGTPNVPGIIALKKGIEFVESKTVEKIFNHEMNLLKYFQENTKTIKNVKLYTDLFSDSQNFAPIISFNIDGYYSEEVADMLSVYGVCVRAGLHCAPLAHKKIGTEDIGTVRISPSVFTQKSDMDFLIKCVRKIAKSN